MKVSILLVKANVQEIKVTEIEEYKIDFDLRNYMWPFLVG